MSPLETIEIRPSLLRAAAVLLPANAATMVVVFGGLDFLFRTPVTSEELVRLAVLVLAITVGSILRTRQYRVVSVSATDVTGPGRFGERRRIARENLLPFDPRASRLAWGTPLALRSSCGGAIPLGRFIFSRAQLEQIAAELAVDRSSATVSGSILSQTV